MTHTECSNWVLLVARENGFSLGAKISERLNDDGTLRNRIYDGFFDGKPAVLKIYDESEPTFEPLDLMQFVANSTSNSLFAPKVFKYAMITVKRGWIIMEHLPQGGKFFDVPLQPQRRQDFITILMEHKKHFPAKPNHEVPPIQQLPPHEFHKARIDGWMNIASQRDQERIAQKLEPLFVKEELLPRCKKGLEIIEQEFRHRKSFWSHALIKHHEVYSAANGTFWLLDFGHCKFVPEGYAEAMIIWYDVMMFMKPNTPLYSHLENIQEWFDLFERHQEDLGRENMPQLLRASLLERIFGMMFADLTQKDLLVRNEEDFAKRKVLLKHLYDILDVMVSEYERLTA